MGKKKIRKTRSAAGNRPPKRIPPDREALVADRVEDIAGPLCDDEGLELVHVEFVHESHQYFLRVYIDKKSGVTMGDCTMISRQLGDLLDVTMPLDTPYRLEVSSPGIRRPLFKKNDYVRFKGQRIKVRTVTAVMGKNSLTGILEGISEHDCVMLSMDGNTVEIDFSLIKSARLTENNGDDRC